LLWENTALALEYALAEDIYDFNDHLKRENELYDFSMIFSSEEEDN